jgi:hypothetical protein
MTGDDLQACYQEIFVTTMPVKHAGYEFLRLTSGESALILHLRNVSILTVAGSLNFLQPYTHFLIIKDLLVQYPRVVLFLLSQNALCSLSPRSAGAGKRRTECCFYRTR